MLCDLFIGEDEHLLQLMQKEDFLQLPKSVIATKKLKIIISQCTDERNIAALIGTFKIKRSKYKKNHKKKYFEIADLAQLVQIRLGNHYSTQFPSKQVINNSVSCQLYSQLITTLFQRVNDSLHFQIKLKTTSDIKTLNHFIRYLNILVKGIIPDGKIYFLCSICKRTFNLFTCPYCNNILIGYKIHPRNNRYYPQKHRLFYTLMVNQLTKKVKKIHSQLYLKVEENSAEWLKMFTIALQDSLLTFGIIL